MLDTLDQLHPDEHYKFGSKEAEVAEFQEHARRVLQAQAVLAARQPDGHPDRVFHMKAHACLAGVFRVLAECPEATRQGIFAVNAKSAYNVLARFSSGVGFAQHDLLPDVRGLALKVFGVSDGGGNTRTVDFLMTNSTNPFGDDQEEFVRFMEANVDPGPLGAHLIKFLATHPEIARRLLKATLKVVQSLATEQYWSGHPYLLGAKQAMKFNVRPLGANPAEMDSALSNETAELKAAAEATSEHVETRIQDWFRLRTSASVKIDPNYLSQELSDRLRSGPIRFVFSVQLAKNAGLTPIEHALVEWKESDSPSIPVAELTLDRAVDPDFCKGIRFTPGNFLPEHRPLGNLGRGRIFTYQASQSGRNAVSVEPLERALFGS